MTFVSIPPEPASPANAKVGNNGFWPDVDLNDFREATRTGTSTIPDARLIAAIKSAIISVGSELDMWWADQVTLGYETLAAVPCHTIGGEPKNVILWRRAVYAYAVADLIETHRDISATKAGKDQALEQMETPDEHRRNAIRAIRMIKGLPGTSVELI